MSDNDSHWIVRFKAFAFDSKEEAQVFSEALTDLFMEMELADGIGAFCEVVEVKDE